MCVILYLVCSGKRSGARLLAFSRDLISGKERERSCFGQHAFKEGIARVNCSRLAIIRTIIVKDKL